MSEWAIFDHPQIQQGLVSQHGSNKKEIALSLANIHCGSCVRRCEQGLQLQPGVSDFEVNLSTRRARLVWDTQKTRLSDLLAKLSELGFPAQPYDPKRHELDCQKERNQALKRLAIAGIGMMQIMMFAVALYMGEFDDMSAGLSTFLRWASLVITVPIIVYSARPFFANAWNNLRQYQLGMDVPIALAIGSAFLASCWATIAGIGEIYFDSVAMFTFLLSLGRFLEMNARHKAAAVNDDLSQLLPAMATRIENGKSMTVPVADLKVDDTVIVKPGETIPADGLILDGVSSIDESLLTGESVPHSRQRGDAVIGGAVNIDNPLTLQIKKVGQDTVLANMARLLDRARLEKPRLARLADQVAAWFVAILLLVATVIFTLWSWYSPEHAFWITLSVLVVTCPCALSLATPTAITVATGTLTRLGLLPTKGQALESLAKVNHIIFDKTGTLTRGHLSLVAINTFRDISKQQSLAFAVALEQRSEHPIATAILKDYSGDKITAESMKVVPGRGIEGIIDNRPYRLGSWSFANEKSTHSAQLTNISDANSFINVFLSDEQGLIAHFQFRDELRAEAKSVINELKSLNIKLEILSGDNSKVVQRIATTLGIENYSGDLMPQDKLSRIRHLQNEGAVIAMIGDGVNDAPSLAQAQVSIAMASGTDIARTSADMVLLSNQLTTLVQGIQLAQTTMLTIRQNLTWALIYNTGALPLAALGFIAPWMAAIGMSMSSLLVVLNSLRLGRLRPKSSTPSDTETITENSQYAYSIPADTT